MPTSNTHLRYVFWIVLGSALVLINQAMARPKATMQGSSATPTLLPTTLETALETGQQVGSTDGIVFMVVIIVLIVVIPIMLRRRAWSNGSRKKKEAG